MKQICKKHGPYESETVELFGHKICETGCPKCEAEATAKEEEARIQNEILMRKENLIRDGIEPEFFQATLENYKPETQSEKEALQAAKDLDCGKIRKLLLLGGNGTGKTHLADALAIRHHGIRITMFELSSKIRAGFNCGQSELSTLNELLSREFIAIDEIGRTKGSDAEKNWLSYLLDKCHTRGIRIMLISNRHIAKNLPQERKAEAIEFFFDNDVISRLRQNAKIVEVKGRDRRAAEEQMQCAPGTMAAV